MLIVFIIDHFGKRKMLSTRVEFMRSSKKKNITENNKNEKILKAVRNPSRSVIVVVFFFVFVVRLLSTIFMLTTI
jgi:hypothetical protein